eukprot:gene18419-13247_t
MLTTALFGLLLGLACSWRPFGAHSFHVLEESESLHACAQRCADEAACHGWGFELLGAAGDRGTCVRGDASWFERLSFLPDALNGSAAACFGYKQRLPRRRGDGGGDGARSVSLVGAMPLPVTAATSSHRVVPGFDVLQRVSATERRVVPRVFSLSLWLWLRGPAPAAQAAV